jgi:aldose sugar dehydrogenase
MQAKSFYFISAVIIAMSVAGCSGNSNNGGNNSDSTSTAPKAKAPGTPNTDYKPAFEGQTKIGRVKTSTAYKVDKIADKLGIPWAIITLPDGRLLMTEKTGYMQIISAEGALVKKITGFPTVNKGGQGGLLDVALDPAFTTNKTIYWSFSENQGDSNLMAVAKGQLSEADGSIKNPVIIFRATPALKSEYHYGSRLLFDKDGNLFVSSGERSILEGRKQAQWLNSGLGKILKITKDGKPAPGNPFINNPEAMPEIYSYGHRNPQSLDIHPVTGDLWEAEFGPRGGDEVNLVRPGKNYGWPIITYGIEYSGEKLGDSMQQKDGMEQPVYYWDPVASPSGMIFYTSDSIPEWKNNLFIACLSSTQVIRLVIENNKVVGEESLLSDKKERLRDITQLNGKLYVVTDAGVLYRISKG